jgi:hypothetical protein
MSLFENDFYRWRETYFVLFEQRNRPQPKQLEQALRELNARYRIEDQRADDDGGFESLTIYSPDDYAAMDITYTGGEEVREQVQELLQEFKASATAKEDVEKLKRLARCDARFDVYHFEELVEGGGGEGDEEEFLDPGSLLIVLERLARACKGVGVDPQSGVLI